MKTILSWNSDCLCIFGNLFTIHHNYQLLLIHFNISIFKSLLRPEMPVTCNNYMCQSVSRLDYHTLISEQDSRYCWTWASSRLEGLADGDQYGNPGTLVSTKETAFQFEETPVMTPPLCRDSNRIYISMELRVLRQGRTLCVLLWNWMSCRIDCFMHCTRPQCLYTILFF